jgi:hypothetical protein
VSFENNGQNATARRNRRAKRAEQQANLAKLAKDKQPDSHPGA